jgi:hypothetical protein
MSQPKPNGGDERSPAQAAHERALGEVSDTLLCIEQAIDRAKRGLRETAKRGGDVNVDLALTAALNDLQRTRKRLMQDTYYSGDALRLL